MRKIIMLILAFCILFVTIGVFINGIGILNINGISDIAQKDKMLSSKILELDNCVNNEYKGALSKINNTYNLFKNSKNEYNEQVVISSLNKSSYASQTERYDADYLMTKIGNYAEDEDVIIKTIVVPSEAVEDYYHLNFMVWGTYLYTANFIYDIESDSKLGFKIDNFKMVPYYTDGSKYSGMSEEEQKNEKIQDEKFDVVCTFTCKDIPIKDLSVDEDTFLTKEMFEVKKVEGSFDSEYSSEATTSQNTNDNVNNTKENETIVETNNTNTNVTNTNDTINNSNVNESTN